MTPNPNPPPRQTITVDLGPLKADWQTWCAQQGATPSAALRAVIKKLATPQPTVQPQPASPLEGHRDQGRVRREISLTTSENELLEQRAKQEGFSVPKWLIALVRAHLTNHPQLGQAEQQALTESNRQLLAIARNLNQLTKTINTNTNTNTSNETTLTPEALKQLSEYLEHHVQWVSAVIESNTERWKLL